jgi:hypothetical protein
MKQEILIAIVAASSALCGVIISQTISLLQSFLNKKHEKQKLLRQKYEEMMFHFSSSLQWIQQVNMCRTQQEIFALAQCPDSAAYKTTRQAGEGPARSIPILDL